MGEEDVERYIKKDIKVTRFLGTLPYRWSKEEKRPEFDGLCSIQFRFFLAQLSLYLFFESFVIFRLVSAVLLDRGSRQTTRLVYLTFTYAIPATLHLCSLYNTGQLHHFISRLLQYRQNASKGMVSNLATASTVFQKLIIREITPEPLKTRNRRVRGAPHSSE